MCCATMVCVQSKCGRVCVVLWFIHDSQSAQRSLVTVVCSGLGGLHFIYDFSADNC